MAWIGLEKGVRVNGREFPKPARSPERASGRRVGGVRGRVLCDRDSARAFDFFGLWSSCFFLIGFRNRLSAVLNWSWNYPTFQRGARLVPGVSGSRMENMDLLVHDATIAVRLVKELDFGRLN